MLTAKGKCEGRTVEDCYCCINYVKHANRCSQTKNPPQKKKKNNSSSKMMWSLLLVIVNVLVIVEGVSLQP